MLQLRKIHKTIRVPLAMEAANYSLNDLIKNASIDLLIGKRNKVD